MGHDGGAEDAHGHKELLRVGEHVHFGDEHSVQQRLDLGLRQEQLDAEATHDD